MQNLIINLMKSNFGFLFNLIIRFNSTVKLDKSLIITLTKFYSFQMLIKSLIYLKEVNFL